MPRVAVKGVDPDTGRKFPREYALLHQVGGSNDAVDSEVSSGMHASSLLLLSVGGLLDLGVSWVLIAFMLL